MTMGTGVVVLLAAGLAAWMLLRWRMSRPDFPPLKTSPDDPLLEEALERAKATVPEFLARLQEPRQSALVKLRFVSSSDDVEHLWAEVLEVLGPDELGVRLVTPPVTHTGPLERLHRCALDDVEDWQVRDAAGKVHGAFSQRAMFAIARRDGVRLPKRLLAVEKEYGEV